jgi:hypothetical protein
LSCLVSEMTSLLPLLARWHGVQLLHLETPMGEGLTPAAVGALGALLERLPTCTDLQICGPVPHPCALLLPALARTSISTVHLDHERLSEARLMLWCAGGQPNRPITVHADCDFSGDSEHLHGILAMAGSAVQLKLRPWSLF